MTPLGTTNSMPSSSTAIAGSKEIEARCSAALSALYEELSRLVTSAGSSAPLPASVAESLGAAFAQSPSASTPALARAVLSLRDKLDSPADAEGPDGPRAHHDALDQAVVQALQGYENARRQRRQAWLSYLTHELKNPLNTVLNSLWLLREKGEDKNQARRFLELAERGARRMEMLVREVRELDEKMQHAPPTQPGADSK